MTSRSRQAAYSTFLVISFHHVMQNLRKYLMNKLRHHYSHADDGCGSDYCQRYSCLSNGVVYGTLHQRKNESVFLYRSDVAEKSARVHTVSPLFR